MSRRAIAALVLPLMTIAAPAAAQLGGSVAAETDYRYRGYSITDQKPALAATLSYDHRSGLYLNGLIVLGAADGDRGVSEAQAAIGYAIALKPGVAFDIGVARTQYAPNPGRSLAFRYTEFYVGIAKGKLAARAYLSPDYFRSGQRTLYLEAQQGVRPWSNWSIDLHLGGLFYLTEPSNLTARARYDWRTTVSRQFGDLNVHVALSGRGPGGDRYGAPRGRSVATAGVSLQF